MPASKTKVKASTRTVNVRDCEMVWIDRPIPVPDCMSVAELEDLNGRRFSCSRDLFTGLPWLQRFDREAFVAILLDGRNRVIGTPIISTGSKTASLVHPREVFRPAIASGAISIALVHNHPSGDPTPSRQDVEVTHRLVSTGEVIGIRVLDHVILGNQTYFSFADHRMMEPASARGMINTPDNPQL